MLVNGIAYLFHPGGLGLRDGGAIAILFSLLCIGIAAMNLAVDFEVIDQHLLLGERIVELGRRMALERLPRPERHAARIDPYGAGD